MNNKQRELAVKMIEKAEASGKNGKIRAEKMKAYLANASRDEGAFGRIAELASVQALSRKTAVSKQGQADIKIRYKNANGKTCYTNAERKTNGGRISCLLTEKPVPFIVYSMCIENSAMKMTIKPRLYSSARFLEILQEENAIKETNGRNSEPAIQVLKRGLWTTLEENGIPFDENKIYTEEELQGI